MNSPAIPAVRVTDLTHSYGDRQALNGVSFDIEPGEIFVLVGPNGGGKTTLFRILSTLIPLQGGAASVFGHNVVSENQDVRASIGVVFQSPSLDGKLTVSENIHIQAALYGMSGSVFQQRKSELLSRLGIADRANDRVETLSGGLKRRVELAKGMIHHPALLLMDEPSTALDPGARSDLWELVRQLRDELNITIVLTSHLLEEADRADRVAILHEGQLVALDTPNALRATVGGDTITIQTADPEDLAKAVRDTFQLDAVLLDGALRLEQSDGHTWITKLVEAFPGQIDSITLGKPTLEDVFIAKTGHRFWQHEANA
ncbi:MAG: ABC transporter ATP-binding protein [Pirellulaceae bacterium]|nr:ABC transporter ATP-binding protein [Pirellulaceae bacterium]